MCDNVRNALTVEGDSLSNYFNRNPTETAEFG
jgi:hypothetical protein